MYYVITRDSELVGLTVTNAYNIGLPATYSIHEMDGNYPDLNTNVWNDTLGEWQRSSSILTKLEFLSRFTSAERISIRSSADPQVQDIMNLLDAASFIDTTNATTVQGIQYLGYVGLLSQNRTTEILA